MAQSRRTMLCIIVCTVLVTSIFADKCDLETQFAEGDQCCKMCGPGKRMKLNTDCKDPVCEDCGDLEYQDGYTRENKCKRQPTCDPNLNFLSQTNPSKTQLSPCQCLPDHHCPTTDCDVCVKNTVCQPGEYVYINGTHTSDTLCRACPPGTFSSSDSAYTCQSYTECSSGLIEIKPGCATSDRICGVNVTAIALTVVTVLLLTAVVALAVFCYRKGKTGSFSISQKVNECCRVLDQPTKEQVLLQIEPTQQTLNQPQENTEDLKLEASLQPGISENGQPVIQDHSKTSLISQSETGPVESF